MKAGDLRHEITVQGVTSTLDATGKRTDVWTDKAVCKASMSDVSNKDYYIANAYDGQETVTFTIRWREGITAGDRVLHGSDTYTVREVNHLGYRRDWMMLKCEPYRGV